MLTTIVAFAGVFGSLVLAYFYYDLRNTLIDFKIKYQLTVDYADNLAKHLAKSDLECMKLKTEMKRLEAIKACDCFEGDVQP